MIRTAAALFAKKTAVVAVTGAVVLGGATLALAEALPDEPAMDPDELMECVEEPCEDTDLDGSDVDLDGNDADSDNDGDGSPDGDGSDSDADDGADSDDSDDTDDSDDSDSDDSDSDDSDSDADDDGTDADDGAVTTASDGDDEQTTTEEPKNHGQAVSQAVHGECADAHPKGHCVREVAKSNAGKGAPAPESDTEAGGDDAAPEGDAGDGEVLESSEAPAAKKAPGKPAHAGGNGKGGPKK
jgi:hypothetical protein